MRVRQIGEIRDPSCDAVATHGSGHPSLVVLHAVGGRLSPDSFRARRVTVSEDMAQKEKSR
jgi:hypothetical protein